MSVIRKKPYIEEVLGNLSASELVSLKECINGSGTKITKSLVDASALITTLDKGISPCSLQLTSSDAPKNGILIYNDYEDASEVSHTQCVFIAYHRFQDVKIFEIDLATSTAKEIKEYCDINELRRIVGDHLNGVTEEEFEELVGVTATDIGEDAEDNLVLLHDGEEITGQSNRVKLGRLLNEIDSDDISYDDDETNTTIVVSGGIISETLHTRLLFEVEGTGVHYGGEVVLHPYNNSECFVAGRLLANGSFKDFSATIDSDGQVNIVIYGVVLTDETVSVHYLSYKN